MSLSRALAAEALGTALLLAIVVGSGIMGERLAAGNTAVALLANSLATGAGLTVLILMFGPISGAHFNPLVSLAEVARRRLTWPVALAYIGAQVLGAFAGVAAAHLMFQEPLFAASQHVRSGTAQMWSEFVAAFGLLATIHMIGRTKADAVPYAVGLYISAAYWFTASTSFANPAVTLARSATDTFAGIRPDDVPGFIVAQLLGAGVALAASRWFLVERSAPTSTEPEADKRRS
jgi:glycerol uptake facilitator-like aquaporin